MMKPERWRQVDQLFQAALDRTPEDRAAFISEACGEDDSLRHEVEALIAADGETKGFIEAPAYAVAAPLIVGSDTPSLLGKSIGHYQIISLLGKGGMGEVYRASDSTLHREVAVKVLPSAFSADRDRLRRFEREARAASALNHPNIITIHEIGQTEQLHFIVTEYVEGQTLRQRMANGRMKLNEALEVAIQIAAALQAAHEAGIIHRDIKPENVMLRRDGLVKVLDFGLAKLIQRKAPAGDSQAPVVAELSTESGVVLGTASYMSPEQARGLKVDHRTDIFSLGVMLYEMVAGRRPFEGETTSDVIASILKNEPPPLTAHGTNTPRDLERIVSKTLRKEREERYQTVKDLILDLKSLQQESNSAAASAAVERGMKRHRSRVLLALISLAPLLAAVGGVYWRLSRSEAPPPIGRSLPLTTEPGFELNPALSPDGKQVAFAWNGDKQDNFDIYIQLVGSNSRLPLTTNPAEDYSPAWSPDGNAVAFLRRLDGDRKELLLVPALGGPERKLAEMINADNTTSRLSRLAWSPDVRWIAVSHREAGDLGEGLFLVSAQTGEKRPLTRPPAESGSDFAPRFSPDGRTLLFTRASGAGATAEMYILFLSEDFKPVGEARRLKTDERFVRSPVWTLDGRHILYLAAPDIGFHEQWELRKIAASGSGKSEQVALLDGVIDEMSLGRHLVYTRFTNNIDIWRAEVPPPGGQANQPRLFISSTRHDAQPRYSPAPDSSQKGSIRFVSFATGRSRTVVATDRPIGGWLSLSPDQRFLLFEQSGQIDQDLMLIENFVVR